MKIAAFGALVGIVAGVAGAVIVPRLVGVFFWHIVSTTPGAARVLPVGF